MLASLSCIYGTSVSMSFTSMQAHILCFFLTTLACIIYIYIYILYIRI